MNPVKTRERLAGAYSLGSLEKWALEQVPTRPGSELALDLLQAILWVCNSLLQSQKQNKNSELKSEIESNWEKKKKGALTGEAPLEAMGDREREAFWGIL